MEARATEVRRRLILMVGLATIFGSALWTPSECQSLLTTRNRPFAPDFVLTTLNSQELKLSKFRGKVVLLDFWATWCDPCREETPQFIELQKKYADRGLQLIGVSMDDDPAPVRDFSNKFHINYPVALGNAKLAESYGGILGLPVAFLIDRDGRIVSRHSGTLDMHALEREIVKLFP